METAERSSPPSHGEPTKSRCNSEMWTKSSPPIFSTSKRMTLAVAGSSRSATSHRSHGSGSSAPERCLYRDRKPVAPVPTRHVGHRVGDGHRPFVRVAISKRDLNAIDGDRERELELDECRVDRRRLDVRPRVAVRELGHSAPVQRRMGDGRELEHVALQVSIRRQGGQRTLNPP